MTKWAETLDISPYHQLYSKGTLPLKSLVSCIEHQLKKLDGFFSSDPELIDIIQELNAFDQFASHKDYEVILDMIYDYGDKGNRLWIETQKTSSSFRDEDTIPERKQYIAPAADKPPYCVLC